jgi:flavin-dependent dehydrogenase
MLAKSGYRVLLVEQHQDFLQNNFSSAATPIETLEKYDLSEDVVGSFWRKIVIETTNVKQSWEAEETLGAVFDFAKLREFLAEEVKTYGGQVWLGFRYVKHLQEDNQSLVFLKEREGNLITVSAKVVVDATGFIRAVMYGKKKDRPPFLKATGIEYLIEVQPQEYQPYQDSLIFLMGHKWMPKGYSWIFPMGNNQLKVGAAIINSAHKIIDRINPLKDYIKLIITDYLKSQDYQLIDVHGSILEYSIGLKDIYFHDNIVAIGDAVSTVNFLGGEGIRHAMFGADIASKHIKAYLNQETSDFKNYRREIKSLLANKWNLSAQISRKVYLEYSDPQIDRGVNYLRNLTIQDMMDILFYYKFTKASRGLSNSLLRKIQKALQAIVKTLRFPRYQQ